MEKKIKIAIVTDSLRLYGGLERQLEGIMELFPNADIFTTYYIKENLPESFKKFNIIESKHSRLLKKLSSFGVPLYPISFENFSFSGYDLVLSITSGFAKDINTDSVRHISYILTPPRFLWNLPNSTQDRIKYKFPLELINNYLRLKDFYSAESLDNIISSSNAVRLRVKKFYRKDSRVLYPFVDTDKFNMTEDFSCDGNFLIISRLEKYKNIDVAIKVFNKLSKRLDIIGDGKYRKYLESISDKRYIKFYGNIEDESMIKIMNRSKALIFPGAEDFGLTPIEALACGKPVIALKKDGVLESVLEGKTGYFFENELELERIINNFDNLDIDKSECRKNSLRFSKKSFNHNLINILSNT